MSDKKPSWGRCISCGKVVMADTYHHSVGKAIVCRICAQQGIRVSKP